MEDHLTEYSSREEEIRDGWRGTYLGAACIVFLVLAFREFAFADHYVGEGHLVAKSLKITVATTFALSLFVIKDAVNYNRLEKIRLTLFGGLLLSIFFLWIIPWTNRIVLSASSSELVWAYVHRVEGRNSLRIGKKQTDGFDYHTLLLEVLGTNEVASPTYQPGRKPSPREKADLVKIKIHGKIGAMFAPGQRIQVKLYRGRWGQSFIVPA